MKKRLFVGNGIFLAAILLIGQTASAQDCAIAVSLAPAKTNYLQDDLFEVNLQFRNQGNAEALLKVVYPLLRHPTGVRLTFTPVGGLVSSANMRVFDAGLTGAPLPLPTGRMISIKVYLQRFLDGFRPGRFDIPWEISVPCEGKSNASSTRGILTINIIQAENPSLQAEFATLVTRAGTRDEEARRNFTETPLRVQEAIEALRVETSPMVLPFLEQLAGSSDSYAQDVAVDAISRFKTNPEARRFVFQALQSSEVGQVGLGLEILTRWQEVLPESDVRSLMNKPDPATRITVLTYLGRFQHPGYAPILEEYSGDPNPVVAAEAKRAAGLIKR